MYKGTKTSLLFNIFSFLFLGFLTLFYSYRLMHYYILEHKNYQPENTKLTEVLINNKGIAGTDDGLQSKDNYYYYGSKSTNNYLYFAGRLWRIISIDSDGNIKIITDEIQTILKSDTNYQDSDIYNFLNKTDTPNTGTFELSLKDQIEKVASISLLTLDDYNRLAQTNYLVNTPFYILNNDVINYINSKGEVVEEYTTDLLGIRPVLTLYSDISYVSGNGLIDTPYQIMNHGGEKITDTYVGEYINFNDTLWRVIDSDESGVTISLESVLDETAFGTSNTFNTSNGIGKYLNTTYYNSIQNKDYIIKRDYYNGSYEKSYLDTYNKKINTYIATNKIGDFFITDYENIFTLNYYPHDNKTIYVINKNKKLYIDYYSSKHNIKPVLKLANDLFIVSGNGTKTNPYEVGR